MKFKPLLHRKFEKANMRNVRENDVAKAISSITFMVHGVVCIYASFPRAYQRFATYHTLLHIFKFYCQRHI